MEMYPYTVSRFKKKLEISICIQISAHVLIVVMKFKKGIDIFQNINYIILRLMTCSKTAMIYFSTVNIFSLDCMIRYYHLWLVLMA